MLVGDVEEPVVAAAAMTPFEAARRVFVLERADTLIEQAANKLLKTLEEPAPFVHLILLTDRLGEVLPTIRSRCQLVRFDALPPAALAERLGRHGVPPEQAAACARLALGDGERALELALGDGPALRAGGEALRARGARRDGRRRARRGASCWRCASGAATRRSAEVEARLAEELELVSRRERKRVENEYAERIRRTRRRVETGALDLGLQLAGPVAARRRLRRVGRRGAGPPRRPRARRWPRTPPAATRSGCARASSWSRTRAAGCAATSPRSWRWRRSRTGSRRC